MACSPTVDQPSPSPAPQTGGTLRIGFVGPAENFGLFAHADFAREGTNGELLRCCLTRTLLGYPGRATVDGGAELQPDLALALPDLDPDGRSWTFHLRRGIHYAPPYEQIEVTAPDIVRGAERTLRLLPFLADIGFPFSSVEGAAEYGSGTASTISGFETPDPYTLVVRLTRPYGGLNIAADLAWAPLPEPLATGHDEDMGLYWPSIGPYMYEQYPADPAAQQVVLTRNPSWDRSTDPRRGAWVDRIEISVVPEADDPFASLDGGAVDFLNTFTPGDVVDRYRTDAQNAQRLRSTGSETLFWVPMNLAVAPFDDLAVRRAVNFVINRSAVTDLLRAARSGDRGPQNNGLITGHVFPDSLTEGLLIGYDPFPSRDHTGDIGRARAEMSLSRYDTDHDGRCDADACRGITMPAPDAALGEAVRTDLAQIGIDVAVTEITESNQMDVVRNHTALEVHLFGWVYSLTGDDLADLLYGGSLSDLGEAGVAVNSSLVGAKSEDLAAWGYSITEVPSVDDVIDRCEAEIGHLRARCWAELDQLLSESVVPWVPLFSFETAYVASPRVADFEIDQSMSYPAIDRVVLGPQP